MPKFVNSILSFHLAVFYYCNCGDIEATVWASLRGQTFKFDLVSLDPIHQGLMTLIQRDGKLISKGEATHPEMYAIEVYEL